MNSRPSVMGPSHAFAQVPGPEIQRSQFDRSHGYKTTFDSGYLVPVFIDEALPGDTFNLSMSALARLATPYKPVMDNMYMDSFFFAVPYRLVWDNWEKFNGQQTDPGDSTDFVIPQMVAPSGGGIGAGTLSDYFGLPTGVDSITFNSLWHRAYNLIWNEWFRDENLQDSVVVDRDDGPDNYDDYVLLKRGKRHDYFTSCLPFPQKGPDVLLPIGGTAPINGNSTGIGVTLYQNHAGVLDPKVFRINDASTSPFGGLYTPTPPGPTAGYDTVEAGVASNDIAATLTADLSSATASTINALREAFQLQRMYEKDARGGTRYTEIIKAHFGVVSPDARLQRPEYLGGSSTPVNFHPIAQTAASPSTPTGLNAQGNLAGFATVSLNGHSFTKSFTEHCLIIGMVSVRADLTYQAGMDRMFSRRTRFDFYWSTLAHLGEQAVLSKEIYCDGSGADDDVFGYQERYAEYRYKPSKITGQFRSNFPQSLDIWHLSQDFNTRPVLDDAFITENPPVDRIIQVPSEPQFLFDSYFSFKCARPMPTYSVPGLIDHF